MKQVESIIENLAYCLTLDHKAERAEVIKKALSNEAYDLEMWVKAGSDQFVLPAAYLQLFRAGLQTVLPDDLKEYLEHLTRLNRERNQSLLEEAEKIAERLIAEGIQVVFLKGTAHLFLGLYKDPAERLIGDIDFLVKEEDMLRAAEIIAELGFKPIVEYDKNIHKGMKHYPRMVNYDYVAAVEIHREVVLENYQKLFTGADILKEKQEIPGKPGFFVPSNRHLIVHNMLNAQINDKAYKERLLLLRQMYDFLLLSQRCNPQTALDDFRHLPNECNAWLALNAKLFNMPETFKYTDSKLIRKYLKSFYWYQHHPQRLFILRTTRYLLWRFRRYVEIPFQAIYKKDVRKGLWKRISNPKWYAKHIEHYLNTLHPNRKYKKSSE